MSNWMMTAEYDYLRPVHEKLRERMLNEDILHADETELKVLKLANQNGSNKGFMWLFRTGNYSDIPTLLYRYEPSRCGNTAKEFLRGFNGYLQTDGYSGYHKVSWTTHVGCWAHARRKFLEAIEAKKGDSIAERSLKPFVIDRKNFLFSNTPNGACSTAVTMSIIETARANDLNPYKYLEWIFKTAPAIANPKDESHNWALLLMPENAADECRTKING